MGDQILEMDYISYWGESSYDPKSRTFYDHESEQRRTAATFLAQTADPKILPRVLAVGTRSRSAADVAVEYFRVSGRKLREPILHDAIAFLLPLLEVDNAGRRDSARDVLVALLEYGEGRVDNSDLRRLADLPYERRVEKKWVACEIYDTINHGVDCTRVRQLAKQQLARAAGI